MTTEHAFSAALGPQAEWMLDPPATTRAALATATAARRPGMAYATATVPGHALHGALARACGLHPEAHGVAAALAAHLGMSRQRYFRLITKGEAAAVVEAGTRAGLYVIAMPHAPGEPGRWIVGDMRVELAL